MKMIDITGYFGCWPHWPIKTNTPSDLIQLLDRWGIDQCAVASTRSIFLDCDAGNQEVLALAKERPERIIGFAVVSARQEEAACRQLAEGVKQGMKGLRLFPQHHQYHLDDDPYLHAVLSLAQDLNIPVLIPIRTILHWGLPQLDVREIDTVARQFPKLNIIIGGINYGELRDALAVMRRHEQVGIETSCMQMTMGIETLVKKVGAERVYFGTGLPLMYPSAGIAKIEHALISDRDKELIFAENAARVCHFE